MRAGEGTSESSAKDMWIPCAANLEASAGMSAAGACTITPTSGWLVVTWRSSWTRSTLAHTAVTSSVEAIHEPTASSSPTQVANVTSPKRHTGIGRTRR